ncbi:MAG: gamma-glutamyltransferase [Reinekea sp.]|nr:gamma-glutamyltransferase [Reinekea sp.]
MSTTDIAFTAPHWAATDAGMHILRLGGTATEAMVAAAAVITVVYPHMNSIGGDSFWLVHNRGTTQPMAIDACGRAAQNLSCYSADNPIPDRGGRACITQAGTIAGWSQALAQDLGATLPLSTLLAEAIQWAETGIEVTQSLQDAIDKVLAEPAVPESFQQLYAPDGRPYRKGDLFKNPELAATFRQLAERGLQDFYQGELASKINATLAAVGSPLESLDIAQTQAEMVEPLRLTLDGLRCFNLPAPTQGVHSLQILSMIEQRRAEVHTDAQWMHLIVEATKQSFADRGRILADLAHVPPDYHRALTSERLVEKARHIDMQRAKPWPFTSEHGDTVWMGARDSHGQLVSFIQSIYWEFGSAVVIDGAGFVWNNRGISFSLEPADINCLGAGKKPRHTLNPAMALFDDGRRLSYGTMGGEGQPQTQATVFSRYVWQKKSLQQAIAEGRWLLGRTWGDSSHDLKVEQNIADELGEQLTALGHKWQPVPAVNEMMGHAGAIADNVVELDAATDPRSDGKACIEQP